MDFESIEELTDEEILGLYENNQIGEAEYIGACFCTWKDNRVRFGTHLLHGYICEQQRSCHYCELQLTTQASCDNLCASLGARNWGGYTTFCVCPGPTGLSWVNNWKFCKR